MNKKPIQTIFILFIMGTLVSAQQASSETIFENSKMLVLEDLVITSPDFSPDRNSAFVTIYADSIEVTEIQLEEEKKIGMVQEVMIVTIFVAFTVYLIMTLFFSDEEEVEDTGGGKEIPILCVGFPIIP